MESGLDLAPRAMCQSLGMNENSQQLDRFIAESAGRHGVRGVAVGIWADEQETYACEGVTSLADPLPVDRDTMFAVGSVSKTFTATALMCLVGKGQVDLAAPVRQYIPEFTLADAQAADRITVLQLLNHTAGFPTRLNAQTGERDDALAACVAAMAELELVAPPGTRASYSQAGFILLGRVIEKLTGLTFERAVVSLLLEPIGLSQSTYDLDTLLTRRFAVGHNAAPDGTLAVVSHSSGSCWNRSRPSRHALGRPTSSTRSPTRSSRRSTRSTTPRSIGHRTTSACASWPGERLAGMPRGRRAPAGPRRSSTRS